MDQAILNALPGYAPSFNFGDHRHSVEAVVIGKNRRWKGPEGTKEQEKSVELALNILFSVMLDLKGREATSGNKKVIEANLDNLLGVFEDDQFKPLFQPDFVFEQVTWVQLRREAAGETGVAEVANKTAGAVVVAVGAPEAAPEAAQPINAGGIGAPAPRPAVLEIVPGVPARLEPFSDIFRSVADGVPGFQTRVPMAACRPAAVDMYYSRLGGHSTIISFFLGFITLLRRRRPGRDMVVYADGFSMPNGNEILGDEDRAKLALMIFDVSRQVFEKRDVEALDLNGLLANTKSFKEAIGSLLATPEGMNRVAEMLTPLLTGALMNTNGEVVDFPIPQNRVSTVLSAAVYYTFIALFFGSYFLLEPRSPCSDGFSQIKNDLLRHSLKIRISFYDEKSGPPDLSSDLSQQIISALTFEKVKALAVLPFTISWDSKLERVFSDQPLILQAVQKFRERRKTVEEGIRRREKIEWVLSDVNHAIEAFNEATKNPTWFQSLLSRPVEPLKKVSTIEEARLLLTNLSVRTDWAEPRKTLIAAIETALKELSPETSSPKKS